MKVALGKKEQDCCALLDIELKVIDGQEVVDIEENFWILEDELELPLDGGHRVLTGRPHVCGLCRGCKGGVRHTHWKLRR